MQSHLVNVRSARIYHEVRPGAIHGAGRWSGKLGSGKAFNGNTVKRLDTLPNPGVKR